MFMFAGFSFRERSLPRTGRLRRRSVEVTIQGMPFSAGALASLATHAPALALHIPFCSCVLVRRAPSHTIAAEQSQRDRNSSKPYSGAFHSGSGAELQIHWQAGRRAGSYIYNIFYPSRVTTRTHLIWSVTSIVIFLAGTEIHLASSVGRRR